MFGAAGQGHLGGDVAVMLKEVEMPPGKLLEVMGLITGIVPRSRGRDTGRSGQRQREDGAHGDS